MKKLDIIIPTFNRAETLFQVLFALHQQDLAREKYTITVVDDGSKDGTKEKLAQWKAAWDFDCDYIYQKNQGQSKARATGVESTSGAYILFLGDDIIPSHRSFLRTHYEALEREPGTIFLGFTTWHPSMMPTRFSCWLESGGPQFDYRGMKDGQLTDFWHFYTSNLSLPRELLEKENFDTKFKGYGYEDIELGYRLQSKHHIPMRFLANAYAWHLHEITDEVVWKRIPQMRQAAEYFEKKHPELHVLPHGLKWLILKILTTEPIPYLAHLLHTEWGWYLYFKREFL